jgi:hypothetical protein
VDAVLGKPPGPFQKRLVTGLLIFMVVATAMLTVGRGSVFGMWQAVYGKLSPEKLSVIRSAGGLVARDAVILGLAGAAFLVMAASKQRSWRGGGGLVAVLLVGSLATSLPHSMRFIQYLNLRDWQRQDPMIDFIRKDKDVFRALPMTGSSFYNRNYLPIFGIETANGFYDNRIRYYETLTAANQGNLLSPNIMRLTNVKYVLTTERVEHPLLALERDFGKSFVYRNTGFLPRAFLVHNAIRAESDSAALGTIESTAFDPSSMIVLADGEPISGEATGDESVKLETYEPDRVKLQAKVSSPAYLFFSENYLPYWKAAVDGRPARVVRADVAMRAIYLEPGQHTVEMRFSSKWVNTGAYICLLSCLVVVGSLVAFLRGPADAARAAGRKEQRSKKTGQPGAASEPAAGKGTAAGGKHG